MICRYASVWSPRAGRSVQAEFPDWDTLARNILRQIRHVHAQDRRNPPHGRAESMVTNEGPV